MKTINVVGCGKVGKTLARLWAEKGVFSVQAVLNRSLQSSRRAVDFLGGGRAVESYAQLGPADVVMISASDESIEACCRELCRDGNIAEGTAVFHCSGSLPSDLLDPARKLGASIASLHPVKSFADPARSVETFAGTYCAVEGDRPARELITRALASCGAKVFRVEPEFKTVYHAATVVASNYLVALMEVGLRCFEKAGVSREVATPIIEPIVKGTLENVFKLGPAAALTGPIARGELSVVQTQCEALGQWDPLIEQVYKALGQVAVELSADQGNADPEALAAITRCLCDEGA